MTLEETMAGLRAAIDAKRNGPTHGDGAPVDVILTARAFGWSASAVTGYGVTVARTAIEDSPEEALAELWRRALGEER